MKKFISILLSSVIFISLVACNNSNKDEIINQSQQEITETGLPRGTGIPLTIYSNSVSDGRGEWLVERASQDGYKIQYVDAGAADIQNRLIAEKNSPIADVTFGLNSIIFEALKSEDMFIQYKPSWSDEVSKGLNDSDENYHAIVKQAILLVYDSNQIKEEDAPKDWIDLWTKQEFEGKYEIHTSLGGGTVRNVIAGILDRYKDSNGDLGVSNEGWQELEQYYKKGVPSEAGLDLYAKISDTSNEVKFGQMWSSGIEARDKQYGTNTKYVVPSIGVPYAVEGIAIINGTKNEEEAKKFVEWFGSAQIQGEWAQEFSTLPANEKALEKANTFNKEIAKIPAQQIDWNFVSENIDKWCEKIELTYMP